MKKKIALIESKIWNAAKVAARLGHSAGWFYAHRPRLEQLGFPKRDTLLGGWHVNAVDAWLEKRSGVISDSAAERMALEAVHGSDYR